MNNQTHINVGGELDWKFGLITRTVYRVSVDEYEIDDTSDGWVTAIFNHDTFIKLINGEISLDSLNWE